MNHIEEDIEKKTSYFRDLQNRIPTLSLISFLLASCSQQAQIYISCNPDISYVKHILNVVSTFFYLFSLLFANNHVRRTPQKKDPYMVSATYDTTNVPTVEMNSHSHSIGIPMSQTNHLNNNEIIKSQIDRLMYKQENGLYDVKQSSTVNSNMSNNV